MTRRRHYLQILLDPMGLPATRTTATIDGRPPSRNAPQEYSPPLVWSARDPINHGFEVLEEGQVVGHLTSRCLFSRSTKITERPLFRCNTLEGADEPHRVVFIFVIINAFFAFITSQLSNDNNNNTLTEDEDRGVLAHLTLTPL